MNAVYIIKHHELPNKILFKMKGEALYQGRRYRVMSGIEDMNVFIRSLNVIKALILSILRIAGLWDYSIKPLWNEIIKGKRKVVFFVDEESIPAQTGRELVLFNEPKSAKARVFEIG